MFMSRWRENKTHTYKDIEIENKRRSRRRRKKKVSFFG
jgi:hypothetical protein